MARLKHYTRSLASGYLLLGVNIAYSLAMVPLALSYLSKPVFGIWGVVVQIGIFLQLTDLGMTGAFSRILIEYKDSKDRGEYASVIKTMWMVFCVQAVVIALLGWLLAPLLSDLFKIEVEYRALFSRFVSVYLSVFALGVALKVFQLTLTAHQRNDLVNLAGMVGFGLNFSGLWLGFHLGWGLWAMALGYGLMVLANSSIGILQAVRIGLIPPGVVGARFSGPRFLEVFDYGKDRFLVSAGASVLQTAPAFLITRLLGLEANATWTVGTRLLYLCFQLVSRVADLAYPALAEMYVRHEIARLRERFQHLSQVTTTLSILAGVALAFLNRDFVAVWTRGRITWDTHLDAMLGLWLVAMIAQRTFWLPAGISRVLGWMRFVYLIEALVMLLSVWLLVRWDGSLLGVMFGVLIASLTASVPYSIWRSARVLETSWTKLASRLLASVLVAGIPMVAAGYSMSLVAWPSGVFSLILRGSVLGLAGIAVMLVQPTFRSLVLEALKKLVRPR